jgi:hypothetical protein
MHKSILSKIAILLLMLYVAWSGKNLDQWGKNRVIQNDAVSYYAYLPAAVIFHDLQFEFAKNLPEGFEGTIWLETAPNGKPILRMTMGLSMLWLPFFLAAHAAAHWLGVSTLGYSWPYSLAIVLAAMTYLFIGLIFLRKLLLRYFSDLSAAVTLILVVAATNLAYYVLSEPGMTHVYNFALFNLFIWLSFKWTDKPGLLTSVGLGLLAGLIVLIRPVNVLILLFPALIGVTSLKDLSGRITGAWKWILVAGVAAFLVVLPQLLYWKMQTGQFLFNSYMDSGKFYFFRPQVINGLFSFRKGWLLYTPVMVFGLAGLFFLRKKYGELYLPVVLFLAANMYVLFSWWCWWYGGSYGMRPMIDMYGIMAIPMAAFFDWIRRRREFVQTTMVFLLVALLYLNQYQMKQYRISLLHWDSMTRAAYVGIWGRMTWPENYESMIKVPDYQKALKGEKEYP